MRRYELTDAQWDLIEDVFPKQTTGRPRHSDRRVLHGILWILCSGATWRDLPQRYGRGKRSRYAFAAGKRVPSSTASSTIATSQRDDRGLINYTAWMIDWTSIRASRAATGAPTAQAPSDRATRKKRADPKRLGAREGGNDQHTHGL